MPIYDGGFQSPNAGVPVVKVDFAQIVAQSVIVSTLLAIVSAAYIVMQYIETPRFFIVAIQFMWMARHAKFLIDSNFQDWPIGSECAHFGRKRQLSVISAIDLFRESARQCLSDISCDKSQRQGY
ncbi:serpentine type 7TM GPCR chemoreceptor srt domain-containing protein [Ditylenchus destructor]|uniref:Serpentine type 7TM GPCR chemoreceptor srt domain-containing protein n=1 Tax=Ditylenchus destructor TaxID=166010 RepID=A0AAD4R1F2_9BILA|nr:serpentine type 7TM GPCR chemoreceptor srt domain-containing protein [Ditylenchus destructor]